MSVLEFISSLKWPVFAIVAIAWGGRFLKKHPGVGRWLADYLQSRDLRGKAGPVEFEATTKVAVEQAAAVTAASDEELAALAAVEPQEDDQDPEGAQPDLSVMRREVVEELLRASARWGWEMAQMGFRSPPNPQVQWTDDGRPEILYGAGTFISGSAFVSPHRSLTPDEIRRRAAAAGEPQLSNAERQAAVQRRLEALRRDADGGDEG